MQLLSPAKINWFFRVLERRSNGFHSVASLLSAIDICDVLYFAESDQDRYETSSFLSWNPHNLIFRAVQLFRGTTGIEQPIIIEHVKNIPMQAGLGGGSSNAATTLWALNTLFGNPLTNTQMQALGAQLGADVPFFFSSGFAFFEGLGEQVTNYPLEKPLSVRVEVPSCEGLSTQAVYQACIPNEASSVDPKMLLQQFLLNTPVFVNDLEPAAFRVMPQLQSIKQQLESRVGSVGMTGSGVAFFHTTDQESGIEGTTFDTHTVCRVRDSWYQVSEKIPSNI